MPRTEPGLSCLGGWGYNSTMNLTLRQVHYAPPIRKSPPDAPKLEEPMDFSHLGEFGPFIFAEEFDSHVRLFRKVEMINETLKRLGKPTI